MLDVTLPTRRSMKLVLGYISGYALILAAAANRLDMPPDIFVLTIILGTVLVALSVTDHHTLRLPNVLTLPLAAVGLISAWWLQLDSAFARVGAGVIGFLAIYLTDRIYLLVRGRHGLGLGDAKLFAASGTWVGLAGLPTVLLWACTTALAYVLITFPAKRYSSITRVPFGPHLALGTWLVWLLGPIA